MIVEQGSETADLDDIVKSVGFETRKSIPELVGSFGLDYDMLTILELAYLDKRLFTCDQCELTLPIIQRSDSERADGFLCVGCDTGEYEDE